MNASRERWTHSSKVKAPAAVLLLLTLTFQIFPISVPVAESASASPLPQPVSVPTVTLRAGSGETIRFRTQNGKTVNGVPPRTLELPHLVLYRNDALTHPDERTLIVEIANLEVLARGVTVTLEVTTQHTNPDTDPGEGIPVWRESQAITNTSVLTQTGVTAVFTHEFTETVRSGAGTIATPTDYFQYDVSVIHSCQSASNPQHVFSEEFALLMENQWVVPLPDVQEGSEGAAPDELVVFYCDMFPFQKSIRDKATWLPRHDVPKLVRDELIPRMVEAFHVQTDVWGFPWHQAWTSYRLGEDAERLSVALSDGRTWFHGRAPARGHSGISINSKGGDNASYETLADGIVSAFHHELFHNLQRNINLNDGGSGDASGEHDAWLFFTEGTAVLASSAGQPAAEFAQIAAGRAYMSYANEFLAGGGYRGNLNKSYRKLSPYRSGIYWRFLYEQCGGMKDGIEDPAGGMQVISRTLTALYSKHIVDISSSNDLIGKVPEIMDAALDGSSCPFQTHAESLVTFSRAIYELLLEGGRCTGPGTPLGCGFYDPNPDKPEPNRSRLA